MTRVLVFGDEAGNFDFRRAPGASLYFILTTVTMVDSTVGDQLLGVRRQLAWDGIQLNAEVHASEESQVVRDAVFAALGPLDFRVDATIFEKAKLLPKYRSNPDWFYKLAWYEHFKYVAPRIRGLGDELLVVAASLGTRKRQALLHDAVQDVVDQVAPFTDYRTAFWTSTSDPCLWVADHCCWAIQRKWERGDTRSYDLIKPKVRSEWAIFRHGKTLYY